MKRIGCLLFSILFLYHYNIGAVVSDTTALSTALSERQSPIAGIGYTVLGNPALQPYAWQKNFSILRLSGIYRNENSPIIMQYGKGDRSANFQVNSYIRLNPQSTVWGNAGYSFGNQKDIYMNSVADFELLYPYIMADTIGGDLTTETYTFRGGYAHNNNCFSWGVTGHYRASIEYRNVDPRPRNVVSDLKLSCGAAYKISPSYLLGSALHGQIYRQRSDIKFMSDLGATRIFHLLGMGMYSTRFSDGNSGALYDGHTLGATLDFMPFDHNGLHASFGIDQFQVKQTLFSHNYLPLNSLKEMRITGLIAWKKSTIDKEKGIELSGWYKNRKGTEFIYGEGGSDNYPKINDSELYINKQYLLSFKGIWGWKEIGKSEIYIQPQAKLYSLESSYFSPSLSLKTREWEGGIKCIYAYKADHSTFQFTLAANGIGNISHELNIELLTSGSFFAHNMQTQYENIVKKGVRYCSSFCYTFQFKSPYAIAVDGKWQHASYNSDRHSNILELGCSFIF